MSPKQLLVLTLAGSMSVPAIALAQSQAPQPLLPAHQCRPDLEPTIRAFAPLHRVRPACP